MGTAIALDTQGAAYVAGETTSGNFPLKNPFQGARAGSSDAFVSKLGPTLGLSMTATASPSPVGVGSAVTYKYTITNPGDTANGVTFTDNLPSATTATFTSATASPGTLRRSERDFCAVQPGQRDDNSERQHRASGNGRADAGCAHSAFHNSAAEPGK